MSRREHPPRAEEWANALTHGLGVVGSLVAIPILVLAAQRSHDPLQLAGATIYGLTLLVLYSASAAYHAVPPSPAKAMLRRLDHSAIFLLIAGGYTPLFTLTAGGGRGHGALVAIWVGASVGIVKSLAWPRAPKWVTAALCVGLGWMVTGPIVARVSLIGARATTLLIACGVVYSLGAVVYAVKRPDPRPLVFGYHEVFHALVILASVLLFAHVVAVIAVAT